jgi:dynein heavy chain, axonemal
MESSEDYNEGLVTLSLNNKNWINIMRSAVEFGKIVLIEAVQPVIDPLLDPLLSRAFTKQGNKLFVNMGGDEPIEYSKNFMLYLQCKLSNPHFRPETAAQCTIINFIVTETGLVEQLLAMVVNTEKPELEEKKKQVMKDMNNYAVELSELE